MKLAAMQPYLFPYIGYFQLVKAVDVFVLLDDAAFINRGWVNRNRILVNGKPFLFTVPLHDASQNRKIKDIEISKTATWKNSLLKTMELHYKKAPSFDRVYPLVESIILSKDERISTLILNSLSVIMHYLGIETRVVASAERYENAHLKGQGRIIDICRKEGATQYVNPPGGVSLYSAERFSRDGIGLSFLHPRPVPYDQRRVDFVPWLSIIDVMMFNSRPAVMRLLGEYDIHEEAPCLTS